jgi:hypothetical protein
VNGAITLPHGTTFNAETAEPVAAPAVEAKAGRAIVVVAVAVGVSAGRDVEGRRGVGGDDIPVIGGSIISGRDFNDNDTIGSMPVALVNERFAATYTGGRRNRTS